MFPARRRRSSSWLGLPAVTLASLSAIAVACSGPGALPTDQATGLPILDEMPVFRGSVAALEWRETSEPAEGMGGGDTIHASIGELVAALRGLAAEAHAELIIGFLGPPAADEATLVIHVAGTGDETVVGEELVAQLRRNDRGWYVDVIRFRMHCRRGIDAERMECT